jgi:hypothetical protein
MARVITLRRGLHTYIGTYRSHAELCIIVLGWALNEELNFTLVDAAAILESRGIPCEIAK